MSSTGPNPDPRRPAAQPFNVPINMPFGVPINMPITQVVFNGFANNHSASEFTSILSFGPRPLISLVMPPAIAKSFALSLLEMVDHYEKSTGTSVHTVAELDERIAAYDASQLASQVSAP
jgi:hypothetical protein